MTLQDPEIIKHIQQRLVDLGYVDISEIDGRLGDITKDVILSFRRRNGLPLIDAVDDKLLRALDVAPPKLLPLRMVVATQEDVIPRVGAVATIAQVQAQSWWGKFWAWFIGLPSGALAVAAAIISSLGDAVNVIAPIKSFLGEAPLAVWLAGLACVAFILGMQAMRAERLAKEASDKMVTGYQQGTVKNDPGVGEVAAPHEDGAG